MQKRWAVAGSLAFFAMAPGMVAGFIPWWLTGWRMRGALLFPVLEPVVGTALIAAGAAVLVHAFARFAIEGAGTPAPPAPTERLVIGGLYRHVRNPMYLAVIATIVGQALLLGQPVLLVHAAVVAASFVMFVHGHEEPSLLRRFGAEYEAYKRAVPAWWPRLRGWTGGGLPRARLRIIERR